MATITGIGAVVLAANDADALAAWYAAKLGLVLSRSEQGFHFGTVGGVEFGIVPARSALSSSNRAITVNYRVDDFEAFVKQLNDAGVVLDDRSESPEGKFAHVRDPEHNRIEIWSGYPA